MTLPTYPVEVENLRDASERSSGILLWIFASPLILAFAGYAIITLGLLPLVMVISAYIVEILALAHFKLNAVRVSAEQFPELDAAADNFAQRLGIARPDVYVIQENMLNAFATVLAGRRVIVLYSGIVDSILRNGGDEELAFVLGHEFGHIAAGHLSFWHRLQQLGSWFIWVGYWHRRRMEITCDRIGLALIGRRETAFRALAHLTVGSVLASRVNEEALLRQLHEHQDELSVGWTVLHSLYPGNLYRLTELRRGAAEFLAGNTT